MTVLQIKNFHIDEFGELTGKSLGPLNSPLTVFYGPNEAGKTTLMAFIRHVLFGFPHANSRENRYMIEGTRRHGGSLQIVTDGGEGYNISRQLGRTAAGTITITTDDGGVLDEAELSLIMGHTTRQVFESIFAFDLDELAAFDVADNSEITNRLYGAGAGAARLPGILREIEQRRDAIFVPRGRNQSAVKVLSELERTESALRGIQDQASEYRRLNQELDDTIQGISGLDDKLKKLGRRSQQLGQWSNVWDTWANLRAVQRRLSELPSLLDFPEDAVSRLEDLEGRLGDAKEDVASASEKHRDAQDAAAEPIPDQLLLARASEIEIIREQRGAFTASVRDLPERRAEVRSENARLEEDLRALGTEWTRERVEAYDISIVRRNEIDTWQASLQKLEQQRRDRDQEIERLRTELTDAQQREKELKSEASATDQQRRGAIRRAVLPSLLLLVGIGLSIAGALAESQLLLGLGVGTGFAAVFTVVQSLVSGSVGITRAFSSGVSGLGEVRRAVERFQERVSAAEESKSEIIEQAEETSFKWKAWLREQQMSDSLTPVGARDFLTQVETAQRRVDRVAERQERADAIQNDIDQYRALIVPIAEEAGFALSSDNQSLITASAEIISRYEHARSAAQERSVAGKAASDRKAEVQAAEREVGRITAEFESLLKAGGTDDPEEFRRLAVDHAERRDLERDEQTLVDSMYRVLGPDANLGDLDRNLTATSIESIKSELGDAEEQLSAMNEERDDLLSRRGELNRNLEQLQGDEEASRLRAKRASLVDQLQAHAEEWSRFSIARALLDRTRQKYEQERQPAVLERASEYFTRMTSGRYERVFQPLDTQGFRVVESGTIKRQKTPDELSRGAREQLYLALRFAAVDEFGERQERLPVIVDEVLVNFDPKRAKQAASAFAQVAKRNQVIVFTCHPWVRDTFLQGMPDARLVDLAA